MDKLSTQLLVLHTSALPPKNLSVALEGLNLTVKYLPLTQREQLTQTPEPELLILELSTEPSEFPTPHFRHIPTLILTPETQMASFNALAKQFCVLGFFPLENFNPEALRQVIKNLMFTLKNTHASLPHFQEMERLKREFLSNISHELQSPLTPLEGYIELFLNHEFGPMQADALEILGIMQTCTQRLRSQIQNLLLLSYLSQESLKPDLDIFYFPDFLHNVETLCRLQLLQKSQKLSFQIQVSNGYVKADIHQLSQVIMVLLENALKFSPAESQIIIRCQNISAEAVKALAQDPASPHAQRLSFLPPALNPQEIYLKLEIEDSGPGIPADKLAQIFDFFYQVDGSATREFGGVGVGLSIAKKILEIHHSLLYLKSDSNQGTCVGFVLPVVTPVP